MKIQGSGAFALIGCVCLLAFVAGCGGGDGQGDEGNAATPSGAAIEPGAPTAQAAPANTCPLSAAEVSEVLGVEVQLEETVCMFEPEPGKNPTVTYVRQVSFACSDAVVNDPDFDMQPFDGLGTKAYASASGNDLLVCTNPPFEITVDITPSLDAMVADSEAASTAARASERAAAEQLARLVLDR
jgi:hypothetical protein